MIVWSVAGHIALPSLALLWGGPRAGRGAAPGDDDQPQRRARPEDRRSDADRRPGRAGAAATRSRSKPVEAPPAPKAPAMTLPDPRSRPRPQPKPTQAPPDATAKTANTGEVPREGSTRVDTRVRGQGFGLSSAGGSGMARSARRDRLLLQRVHRSDGGRDPAELGSEPGSRRLDDDAVHDSRGTAPSSRRRSRNRAASSRSTTRRCARSNCRGCLPCRGVREPDADRASTIRLSAVIMSTHLMTWRLGAVVVAAVAFVAAPAITAAVRQAQQPSEVAVGDQRRSRARRRATPFLISWRSRPTRPRSPRRSARCCGTTSTSSASST